MPNQPELERAVEAALETTNAFEALRQVAGEFKNCGVSKELAYATLDTFRKRHEDDSDERKYNAVLDVMDLVDGWCSPHARIYDPV